MKATSKLFFLTSIACILVACGGGSDEPQEPASAESCFDIATYSLGAPIKQQYDDARSNPSGKNLVIGIESTNATFNGISGLLSFWEKITPTTISPMGFGSSFKTSYLSPITDRELSIQGSSLSFYGGPYQSFENVVYSPVLTDKKFNLKQGETLRSSVTAEVTTSSLLEPTPVIHNIKIEKEVVFEGRDVVTIGSRSVTACRFNYGTHREWFYRGILIKMDNGNGKTILRTEALTRDGQPY